MFLYVVDCPFNFVLLSVKSQLFIVTVFAPSITIPSDAFATNAASFTEISAVEYIDGEPFPVVVIVESLIVIVVPSLDELFVVADPP